MRSNKCYEVDRQKVAIVTGSSSGMGYETSLMLARNGFHTYATMRKLDGEGGGSKQIIEIAKNEKLPLQVIQLDVNNDKSVTETINRIANEKGRIDVVINNAGYDLNGSLRRKQLRQDHSFYDKLFIASVNTLPEVGLSRAPIIFSNVDFPLPEWPTTETNSPLSTEKLTFLSDTTLPIEETYILENLNS